MLGQNVMVGPRVKVGSGRKIQNNVALYGGVELDDDVPTSQTPSVRHIDSHFQRNRN